MLPSPHSPGLHLLYFPSHSLTQPSSPTERERERGRVRGVVRFDLVLLWGFEVCVDERKWSTVFRQAPNEGIKKLRRPVPHTNFPGTKQDK